ncbi:MAG: hypothetical protein WC741_02865 [Patescibacteria group bacterium]|jgi:hypothetical protein
MVGPGSLPPGENKITPPQSLKDVVLSRNIGRALISNGDDFLVNDLGRNVTRNPHRLLTEPLLFDQPLSVVYANNIDQPEAHAGNLMARTWNTVAKCMSSDKTRIEEADPEKQSYFRKTMGAIGSPEDNYQITYLRYEDVRAWNQKTIREAYPDRFEMLVENNETGKRNLIRVDIPDLERKTPERIGSITLTEYTKEQEDKGEIAESIIIKPQIDKDEKIWLDDGTDVKQIDRAVELLEDTKLINFIQSH